MFGLKRKEKAAKQPAAKNVRGKKGSDKPAKARKVSKEEQPAISPPQQLPVKQVDDGNVTVVVVRPVTKRTRKRDPEMTPDAILEIFKK